MSGLSKKAEYTERWNEVVAVAENSPLICRALNEGSSTAHFLSRSVW